MTSAERLLDLAIAAREAAYAPYSNFRVGAALSCPDGSVFAGCNVENVAFPEGTCAEAGAIAAMCLAGKREIAAVLVVADSPDPVTPCGGCRQKLAEFAAPETPVILADLNGPRVTMTIADLLPGAFTPAHLARATAS